MKTPDGREFTAETAAKPLGDAARAAAGAVLLMLRAAGKVAITTWRLAAALDSALWRATKLIARKGARGLAYAAKLALSAFHSLLLWLPTRAGRAYSAVSGVVLVVAGLWIVDELRAGPSLVDAGASALRPPIDEDDPILARIEGRYVHLSEIEAAARAGGFLRPGETLTPKTAFERELVESYVEQRLLARAALGDGLQRTPSVTRRVNAARDRVLAAAFMETRIKKAVTAETIERLYQSQANVTALGDEVRARHIVVETSEEAAEILALLKGGADFGELARERSLDRATAPLGGEVGWFTRAMMAPAFSRAAFAAKTGEIAAPFQSEFGWHILQVSGRRPTQAVSFSEVRDNIEDFLRMRTIDATLRELEEESQVVYFRFDDAEEKQTPPPPDLRTQDAVENGGSSGEETLR